MRYEMRIAVINKTEALKLSRKLSMRGLIFPVGNYSELKRLFDALHENDNHTITLKQGAR
jgi:hypothetical protein